MSETATCRLCQPREDVDVDDLMDHLRLFHPEYHEQVTAALSGEMAGPAAPDPEPGAPFGYPVMTAADLEPHGVVCDGCGYVFRPGDLYVKRLLGMIGGIPATTPVCVPCGEPPPDTGGTTWQG